MGVQQVGDDVATHKVTGIQVICPSVVMVDEPFDICIRLCCLPYVGPIDHYSMHRRPNFVSDQGPTVSSANYLDDSPPAWSGELSIGGGESYRGPTVWNVTEATPAIVRIGPVRFAGTGTVSLTVTDEETGSTGQSNMVEVIADEPANRLFWGDIHCHTFYSDGLRSPEQVCQFARDHAGLDIFAMTDHGGWIHPNLWRYYSAVTDGFNEPGRFVTFHAQEWEHRGAAGHLNVYYPDGATSPLIHQLDKSDYDGFLADAQTHGGLIIHHHSASTFFEKDWGLHHDENVQRLVEIYSCWGNSEEAADDGNPRPIRALGGECEGQHVVDALNAGLRLGFVGGGDTHDGRPGASLHHLQEEMKPFDWHLLYPGGIMGVWAEELTRDSVFRALQKRSVFATTGERTIVEFAINGHKMGSEFTAQGPLALEAKVSSEVAITELYVLSANGVVLERRPNATTCRLSEEMAHDSPAWYYLRAVRRDGGMAWSSPIWVD